MVKIPLITELAEDFAVKPAIAAIKRLSAKTPARAVPPRKLTKGITAVPGSESAMAVRPRGKAIPPAGTMPEVAERYPLTGPPKLAFDKKKGKEYLAKDLTPEALKVQKLRKIAQTYIDKGEYEPFFDPAARFDVDPSKYAVRPDLSELLMKRADTRAKYDAKASGPEALQRLSDAYERGATQKEGAGDWYHVGQLEKRYIDEFGPEEGRQRFAREFADSMAATTGGASPKDNYVMAHYGNYMDKQKVPVPENAYDYPFPVGGRFAGTNMEQFRKMITEGAGITTENPKRSGFSGNFLGNKSNPTIDEQMMGLIEPGSTVPQAEAYGHYANPVIQLAKKYGVDPRYFQEVAWAGAKDAGDAAKGGYAAKPFISEINEAIERTHYITGMPRNEIFKRGVVRKEIPLYGLTGGLGLAGALGASRNSDPEY